MLEVNIPLPVHADISPLLDDNLKTGVICSTGLTCTLKCSNRSPALLRATPPPEVVDGSISGIGVLGKRALISSGVSMW